MIQVHSSTRKVAGHGQYLGWTDYFVVKNRRKWREEFESWLETDNADSYFDDESDESDDDTVQEIDCRMEKVDAEDEEHDTWLEDIVVDDSSDM